MAFKFFALVSLIAAASAGLIPVEHHEQPQLYHAAVQQPQHVIYQKPHEIHAHAHAQGHEVYPDDPHPKYNFAYDVQDAVSGDSKSQVESRDGDVVQGEYSLDDADGFRRTVKYTADSVNGFNAVVHREPLGHVQHHKLIAAAPAAQVQYQHQPAPLAYSPPAYVKPSYAAPAAAYQQQQQQQQEQQQQQQQHYAHYESAAPAGHNYYHQ